MLTSAGDRLSPEERLRLATEVSEIGWWEVEDGYGHLHWPPILKAMFGISADVDVTLADFFDGLHVDDREHVADAYARAVDPAQRGLYDVKFRTIGREDGVVRWISAKGLGVFGDDGRCERFIGTAIDITQGVLAQEKEVARARELADLREQFIAVLGHDLKNPLAAVASGTRLLVRQPERAGEIAAHVERSIGRMEALIDNILDFARGRLGGTFYITRDMDRPLVPVLLQVIDELRAVHPERVIVTDIELDDVVQCDCLRIGQLLSNILGNALVYGAVDVPVVVRARAEGGVFALSVRNGGPTIKPADLGRLFEPFFRAGGRGNREGLGLGLYICAEIAKAHGGTIGVTSERGETCFVLRMPLAGA